MKNSRLPLIRLPRIWDTLALTFVKRGILVVRFLFLTTLIIGNVVATAAPTLELVKSTELSYPPMGDTKTFTVGGHTYTHSDDITCDQIVIASAMTHEEAARVPLARELSGNPERAVATLFGEPYMLFWDISEYVPLFGGYLFPCPNIAPVQPQGFERKNVQFFTHRNEAYALFMGRSGGGHVNFYRMNLLTGKEEEFIVNGMSTNDRFEVVSHEERVYGIFADSSGARVFDVMRDNPLVKDIEVVFPFIHPNGTMAAKVFRYKGEITIPLFDKKVWWHRKGLVVNFTKPFDESGKPVIGEGINAPGFDEAMAKVAAKPGATVEHLTLDASNSNFFVENGELHAVVPVHWSENGHSMKRIYIVNRETTRITQVALPSSPLRPGGVFADNAPYEISGNLRIFVGPDQRRYGFYVSPEADAFLIQMSTGEVLSQLALPKGWDGERFGYSPRLFTTGEGLTLKHFAVGESHNYEKSRRYTIKIHF